MSESDKDRIEEGEIENEESMDFESSQYSDFQRQYDSWEKPTEDSDAGTQDSEMVQVSQDISVGTQDSVMVRVSSQDSSQLVGVSSQDSSQLVRVLSEELASTGTQESVEHSQKQDTDSSYSPGTEQ